MRADLDPANSECLSCHAREMPGLYKQWASSLHAKVGVGCVDCHAAEPDDVDGYDHHDFRISTLVTPKDCGGCHEKIAK